MPPGAVPLKVRLVLGREGALQLWQGLWDHGTDVGRSIGVAEGAIAASFCWVALILFTAAVLLVIRRLQ